jgi:hypothetical protein
MRDFLGSPDVTSVARGPRAAASSGPVRGPQKLRFRICGYDLIVACIVATFGLWARPASATCNKCASFIVPIQIVNGVVRTGDAKQAEITHKEFLPQGRKIPDDKTLKKILTNDLDDALKQMSPLYWYALNSTDQKDPTFQKDNIPQCLSGTYQHEKWAEFRDCYDKSLKQIKIGPHGFKELRMTLPVLQGAVKSGGALQSPDSHPPSDALEGKLTFFIVAPDSAWSASLPNDPGLSLRKELAEYLDKYDQCIWRREHIIQLIQDFYTRRGLVREIQINPNSQFSGKPPAIRIKPDPKIILVNLVPPPQADDADREISLYNLFSTRIFNGRGKFKSTQNDTPVAFESLSLPADLQPLFNSIPFTAAQGDLGARGLTVSQGSPSDSDSPAVFIEVHKNQSDSKAGKAPGAVPVSPGAPAVPSARSSLPETSFFRNRNLRTPVVPTTASGKPQDEQLAKAPPRDKKGYVGVGFSYQSGQGVRPIGALEYQRLFGVADVTMEAGTAMDLPNGSGSASFDYLGFGRLHHRLSVDLKGGSDTTYHRLLGLRQLDERRNGGTGHAQIELVRNPLGSSFRVFADGDGQTVTLTDPKLTGAAATVISDTLSGGDVGATYVLSLLHLARPLQLQVEPVIRTGTAANGSFARSALTATYHQEAIATSVFEVKAQFAAATDQTPVYELPSLGGVSSLRGFRADDELAQRVWTVQPELWHGVPLSAGADGAVAQFVNNSVRLAAFCDFGGAYQTYAGPSGTKAGPGAGLRVQFHQVTLRLDWAYGLGTVASGHGHGRAYFSISMPFR